MKIDGLMLIAGLALLGGAFGSRVVGSSASPTITPAPQPPPSEPVIPQAGQGVNRVGYDNYFVGDHVALRFWDSPPNDYVHGATIVYVETGGNYGDGSPAIFNIDYGGRVKTFTWNQFMSRTPSKEV